jgi:guanosine-3',5'-bis(diphosphate) 3'-pyrophosphohydrolase
VALQLAVLAHRDQDRRGRDLPVIAHIIEVVGLLVNAGVSDRVILCAATLHDAVEDAATPADANKMRGDILDLLSAEVLELVDKLTKPVGKSSQDRHDFMMEHIKTDWKVALIKLADRTSNIANFHQTEWKEPKKDSYLSEAEQILSEAMYTCMTKIPKDSPNLPAASFLASNLAHEIKRQGEFLARAVSLRRSVAPGK